MHLIVAAIFNDREREREREGGRGKSLFIIVMSALDKQTLFSSIKQI